MHFFFFKSTVLSKREATSPDALVCGYCYNRLDRSRDLRSPHPQKWSHGGWMFIILLFLTKGSPTKKMIFDSLSPHGSNVFTPPILRPRAYRRWWGQKAGHANGSRGQMFSRWHKDSTCTVPCKNIRTHQTIAIFWYAATVNFHEFYWDFM